MEYKFQPIILFQILPFEFGCSVSSDDSEFVRFPSLVLVLLLVLALSIANRLSDAQGCRSQKEILSAKYFFMLNFSVTK